MLCIDGGIKGSYHPFVYVESIVNTCGHMRPHARGYVQDSVSLGGGVGLKSVAVGRGLLNASCVVSRDLLKTNFLFITF